MTRYGAVVYPPNEEENLLGSEVVGSVFPSKREARSALRLLLDEAKLRKFPVKGYLVTIEDGVIEMAERVSG